MSITRRGVLAGMAAAPVAAPAVAKQAMASSGRTITGLVEGGHMLDHGAEAPVPDLLWGMREIIGSEVERRNRVMNIVGHVKVEKPQRAFPHERKPEASALYHAINNFILLV